MAEPNYIVSLSGGKDSTAMLHMMLERGENVHSAVFCDTGWEFPEMFRHLDLIKKNTGIEVVVVKSAKSFEHWMYRQEVVARSGLFKGEVVKVGNGWPSMSRRWCTREKVAAIQRYEGTVENVVPCVGYAVDEVSRERFETIRYPLDEYGMTESDCLNYCKSLGYHWDGLYELFRRVSCYCCPLQSEEALKKLREHYPGLYAKVLLMDIKQPRHNPGFIGYKSVMQFEEEWRVEEMLQGDASTWLVNENKQQRLFV